MGKYLKNEALSYLEKVICVGESVLRSRIGEVCSNLSFENHVNTTCAMVGTADIRLLLSKLRRGNRDFEEECGAAAAFEKLDRRADWRSFESVEKAVFAQVGNDTFEKNHTTRKTLLF